MSKHHSNHHHGQTHQDIDVHSVSSSGKGSVAAGDDISHSTVTTGHGNQVGNGNLSGNGNVVGSGNQVVAGHDDTTAFGAGHATSAHVGGNLSVGDGAAFASGGGAAVDNSDNSLHNVGNNYSDHSVNNSFKDLSDHSVHDSGNILLDSSTHDSGNTDIHYATSHSFNNESDNHVDYHFHV